MSTYYTTNAPADPIGSAAPASDTPAPQESTGPAGHTVTVYSTTSCPFCVYAKQFFDSKGVKYTDKNVGVDRAAATEMVQKSGQMGVPVIDIDGTILVGFQPDKFAQLLGINL